MSFVSLLFLHFSAPISFFLGSYESSAVVVLRAVFSPVLIYIAVKGRVIYLILLERRNVLVQLFSRFRVGCFFVDVGVGEIGDVELKVRRVVDKKLFWWN